MLFPHKRIVRKSEMTAKGLVVTEEQEEIAGLPSSAGGEPTREEPGSPTRKSPIADLLYMRWLEGLKIKWPSLLSVSSSFFSTDFFLLITTTQA
jgi:serine/threonine-protein kinase 24/25/MST4